MDQLEDADFSEQGLRDGPEALLDEFMVYWVLESIDGEDVTWWQWRRRLAGWSRADRQHYRAAFAGTCWLTETDWIRIQTQAAELRRKKREEQDT